ncbi:MAG: hypothetical protein GTO24_13565 [candidate division Zixibacteria bacterium]|nr:hypothetical protein [candidate division Zixibacteria bacterium]
MDLEDRLKSFDRFDLSRAKSTDTRQSADKLIELLGASIARNTFGDFVLVRKSLDGSKLQQEIALSPSCSISGEWLAGICLSRKSRAREQERIGFDLKEAVFVDCETTGLAGGAGTYAFLVGLGYHRGKDFRVEQYFMQDFHQERAVLTAVAEKLGNFKSLVSFNGKCYDVPLLQNRFVINRIEFDPAEWAHFDLLFPCRRLWKRRIGECNLSNIEHKILGVRRKIDVPSYLVPQIYFDYLRTGEAESLVSVFHHNLYDILSLLKLSVVIDQALSPELAEEDWSLSEVADPIDLYSLGRIHRALGNFHSSARCFEQALCEKPSAEWQQEIHASLAFAYKRMGRIEEAASIWQNLTAGDLPFSFFAHEELAKYYEHKTRDYLKALSFVKKAITQLSADLSAYSAPVRQRRRDSLEYRKARLERKLKMAAGHC